MKKSVFAILIFACYSQAWALSITNVQHEPAHFIQKKHGKVKVVFRLSEPAPVTLKIYDGRDLLIREVESDKVLAAGDNQLNWDGMDKLKRPVPPEAYHYTLVAKDEPGGDVEYDVTDLTRDRNLTVKNIKWDNEKKHLSYLLLKPGRVNIRIGIKENGPLLKTLINWVPRAAGTHNEKWDGKDESDVIDLSKHPKLNIWVQAFSLGANAIVVGKPATRVNLIQELNWLKVKRTVKKKLKKRIYAHVQQPIEKRGDFSIKLQLPDDLPVNSDGLPVISGRTPIRLGLDSQTRQSVYSQRFEPVFYIDGKFAYENETGYLPMTWNWDPVGINEGIHYITANLRGYEGNFGFSTVKVFVRKGK